jgi:Transglycosylase-like domain
VQSGMSRRQRLLAHLGKARSALVLSGVLGLAVIGIGAQAGLAPKADAAGNLWYHYQAGYYLDNGWLCYGWANGVYHCTAHWHRDASGRLISDNVNWVPNIGSAPTTHAAPAHVSKPAPAAPAPASAPAHVSAPAPAAPSGSVQSMIASTFGPYAGAALNVARCESTFNPNAHNPSGASGVFQFMPSTWATTSYAGYSPYNAWANIQAAHQVFVRDGYSWREWSCAQIVGVR